MTVQRLHSPEHVVDLLHRHGVQGLCVDSRRVRAGDVFIAWPGAAVDAREHVAQALESGAVLCLIEAQGMQNFAWTPQQCSKIVAYEQLKPALSAIADLWYQHPSEALDVVAVTGTNGKTSTVWWLAQALSGLDHYSCAMMGTLGLGEVPAQASHDHLAQLQSTGLTTPDPVAVQRALRTWVDQGIQACAMEASSIGLVEHRMDAVRVRVAVFTNFTQDHLDYHGTMQAYWEAKKALFTRPDLRAAVVNVDDERGRELAAVLNGRVEVWSIACRNSSPARLRARFVVQHAQGLSFVVQEQRVDGYAEQPEEYPVHVPLLGEYNVSNVLGVMATMRALGVSLGTAVQVLERISPVPGRMDCQGGGSNVPLVVVDYAHTADALEKVLCALRPVAHQRQGRLWCVFGCGGDRDPGKRPVMAAVAQAHADMVMVTSDNPRSEKPAAIIGQILLGLDHTQAVEVQADRRCAIEEVIAQARSADVILVAGKGHENYQEIQGVRHPFVDQDVVRAALAKKAGGV